jgi:adenosylcobinamide kinase/adenosylcobinamide-phosphate guanylyltransferase
MSSKITLILGGARSGKSRRAEHLASLEGKPVVYVATYVPSPVDEEMGERISKHRATRPATWLTVENVFVLEEIFAAHRGKTVLIDCLTLWLSHQCESSPEPDILEMLGTALLSARTHNLCLYIVSNELGMGLVPSTPLGRSFRDLCGRANQKVAAEADHVEFQIAGIPLILKGDAL